jgi:hypothetical protein
MALQRQRHRRSVESAFPSAQAAANSSSPSAASAATRARSTGASAPSPAAVFTFATFSGTFGIGGPLGRRQAPIACDGEPDG